MCTGECRFLRIWQRPNWERTKHPAPALKSLAPEAGGMAIPPKALKVGDRHPLGIGGGGLAILSALPDDEVDVALSTNTDVIARNYPLSPVHVIRHLIAKTRAKAFSVNGHWELLQE
jgi:DNA-binding IclR family transcriptional regulator